MRFGPEVKSLREAKGLSQKQLAEAIGVTQPTIANLEKGKRPRMTMDNLYRLCDALGVSCEHFRECFVQDGTTPTDLPEKPKTKKPRGRPKKGD